MNNNILVYTLQNRIEIDDFIKLVLIVCWFETRAGMENMDMTFEHSIDAYGKINWIRIKS